MDSVSGRIEGYKNLKGRLQEKMIKNRKIGICVGLVAVVLFGILFFHWKSSQLGMEAEAEFEVYEKHFAMITGRGDSDFWDKVYESALEEGKARGIYIERFGKQLAVEYSRNELIETAISASVDGIIVPGDEDEKTVELIDKAVGQGIPVVTVLQDSTGSLRQCFVGNNSYNLGQEYGRQILDLLAGKEEEPCRILVLVDDSRKDTSQNLILLGIREILEKELGENHAVSVETAMVDTTRSFSPEESIRDIFLNTDSLPDIMVCLNEVYTRCAYQAAVDYNKVGTVQLLGFYDSETILNAVEKNIIYATVALDTEQMGRLCVEALDEYLKTGYTNGYMAVDTRLITAENVEKLEE